MVNVIIDEDLARRAKEMNSFNEYVTGSTTAEYKQECIKIEEIAEQAKQTSYNPDKIDYMVEHFETRLANWYNDYNRNSASCPSIMICGGSNFPTRKKERQNAKERDLWKEYDDIMSIKSKIWGVGKAIQSNNENALEILQNKLDSLKKHQEKMKQANSYYRKNKTMIGYAGITEEEAKRINENMKNGYSWCNQPYTAYTLTNNNANIHRIEERLKSLKEVKEAEPKEKELSNGIKYVENTEQMRVQLLFDGKPTEEVRTVLKSHGFRWSPRNMAWQRQLTTNGKYEAENVIKIISDMQ